MTQGPTRGGKLPGKTLYAGRRRAMTRKSGFKAHEDTTGGEFRRLHVRETVLQPGDSLTITFVIAGHAKGDLIGYGVWFWRSEGVTCSVDGGSEKRTLTDYGQSSWNKAGSMWSAQDTDPVTVTLRLEAVSRGAVGLYEPLCGRVQHKHLDGGRDELMRNMYQFAPEALFISQSGAVEISGDDLGLPSGALHELVLKSCNRCGRFLPVNVPVERDQLSFSNHCVADHRRPCKHATFGKLRNVNNVDEVLQLDYGFQLECRFCKKFEVNAAHNPQRTAAQMKEDGARRRAFELLLSELYGGTPQLKYKNLNGGKELADVVWDRFGRRCFNCGAGLKSANEMHLDHTRPLAMLWPLDDTATALCGSCNSQKRDRTPSQFYKSPGQLEALSDKVGIPIDELVRNNPNEEALTLLRQRLDWFFGEFLLRDEMTKERDGKIAGELVVKALQKVFARSKKHSGFDLEAEYERRRSE
jgi:hypothetical protein